MAQPYAATRQLTLDDLLAGGGGTSPVPYAASQQAQEQGMSPAESALLAAIMDGGDQAPRTAEKPNLLGQILMGLGDAGTTYASVLGNAPGVRTNSLGEYQQYLQRQKASTEQANERIKENKDRRKLQGAEFLYGKEQQARQRADVMTDRAAAAKEAAAYKTEQLNQAKEIAAAKVDQDAAEMASRERVAKWQIEGQLKAAGIGRLDDAAKKGDKAAADALEKFSTGARITSTFARGFGPDPKTGDPGSPPLAERLKNGESPADITREFESELNKAGVFGHGRDLSRNDFNEALLRAFHQVEQEKNAPKPAAEPGFIRGGVNAWDSAVTLPQPGQ